MAINEEFEEARGEESYSTLLGETIDYITFIPIKGCQISAFKAGRIGLL